MKIEAALNYKVVCDESKPKKGDYIYCEGLVGRIVEVIEEIDFPYLTDNNNNNNNLRFDSGSKKIIGYEPLTSEANW